MDFYEAENRFRWLASQRAAGALTDEQLRFELNRLRVTDPWGRLWMMQEATGQWHVYQDSQWVAAQPPYPAPPPPLPSPAAATAPVTAMPPTQPRPGQEPKRGGCLGKLIVYLLIWAVTWLVIGLVIYFFAGREQPMAVVAGIGAAALLSLVLMLASLSSAWSGVIVDLRRERHAVSEDDGTRWEEWLVAHVRQPSGKIRKVRAPNNWRIGDRLEKRRGEAQIRHYPAGG